jgi:hypothetical protein
VELRIAAVCAGFGDFGLRQPAANLQRVKRKFRAAATTTADTCRGGAETGRTTGAATAAAA